MSEEYNKILTRSADNAYRLYQLAPNGDVTEKSQTMNPTGMEIAALFQNDFVLLKSDVKDPNSLDLRLERWGDDTTVMFEKSLTADGGYNYRP